MSSEDNEFFEELRALYTPDATHLAHSIRRLIGFGLLDTSNKFDIAYFLAMILLKDKEKENCGQEYYYLNPYIWWLVCTLKN
ncbi:hypothetical protein P8452_19340 [Trifolium repens]|nr:hypothetical protein P8452_19340 [Trifolium repens]